MGSGILTTLTRLLPAGVIGSSSAGRGDGGAKYAEDVEAPAAEL